MVEEVKVLAVADPSKQVSHQCVEQCRALKCWQEVCLQHMCNSTYIAYFYCSYSETPLI